MQTASESKKGTTNFRLKLVFFIAFTLLSEYNVKTKRYVFKPSSSLQDILTPAACYEWYATKSNHAAKILRLAGHAVLTLI